MTHGLSFLLNLGDAGSPGPVKGEAQSFLRSRERDSLNREEKPEGTWGEEGRQSGQQRCVEEVAGPVEGVLRRRCPKRGGQQLRKGSGGRGGLAGKRGRVEK